MFNYLGVERPMMSSQQQQSPDRSEEKLPGDRESINPGGDYQDLRQRFQIVKRRCMGLQRENQRLKDYIVEMEEIFQPEIKKKRHRVKRRTDNQLDKQHTCPCFGCRKEYASELALSFHIRGKHHCGTKTERVVYVKKLLQARKRGSQLPLIPLNWPPEIIEYEIELMKQKCALKESCSQSLERELLPGDNVRGVSGSHLSQGSYV